MSKSRIRISPIQRDGHGSFKLALARGIRLNGGVAHICLSLSIPNLNCSFQALTISMNIIRRRLNYFVLSLGSWADRYRSIWDGSCLNCERKLNRSVWWWCCCNKFTYIRHKQMATCCSDKPWAACCERTSSSLPDIDPIVFARKALAITWAR